MANIDQFVFFIHAQYQCAKMAAAAAGFGKTTDHYFLALIAFYFQPLFGANGGCIRTFGCFCNNALEPLLCGSIKELSAGFNNMIAVTDHWMLGQYLL